MDYFVRISLFSMLSFMCMCAFSLESTENEHEFSANELKTIRGVSQNILKVRGQQRRDIVAQTQPVRDLIERVDNILTATSVELDKPVLHRDTQTTIIENRQQKPSFLQRIFGRDRSFDADSEARISSQSRARVKLTQDLEKARQLVQQRSRDLDRELPRTWQVWAKTDARKQRVREKLADLDAELLTILSEPEISKKQIDRLRDRLKKDRLTSSEERSLDPTITTITKHHRK